MTTHSTVGVCSKCADVTSLIFTRPDNSSSARDGLTWMLPTGLTNKLGESCFKSGKAGVHLQNMAVTSVLQTLNQGKRSFANTTNLFDSFANAMTNRFRFGYGSATFSKDPTTFDEPDRNMPLGEIQGVAWQDSTCVQMQVKWLLLPICLTVLTTVLMMWTVGANWIGRRSRPVWKGSLFPLIFYRDRIESKEEARGSGRGEVGREGKLMGVNEMSEISKKMPATFAFPDKDGGDRDAGSSGYAQKQGKSWFRWRGRGKKDADALLGSAQK